MHTYIRHLFRLPGSTGSHNLLSEVKYRLKENSDCRSPTATEQPNTVIQGLCLGKIYGAIETGRYTYGRQTIFQQCFVTVGWVTGIGHPAYSKKNLASAILIKNSLENLRWGDLVYLKQWPEK